MKWGVWEKHHLKQVHTAPMNADGTVGAGHMLSPLCACRPTPEQPSLTGSVLWRHHDHH